MFKQTHKLSAGFTMLEMLIALLVLSIGLLGVATLQSRGQQFNQIGYLRTQATFLAYDIMDRIRINSDQNTINGNGDNGTYALNPTTLTQDCDQSDCTPQDLVIYDLIKWHELVQNTLPGGNADINWGDVDSNGVNEYAITIEWTNIINREEDAEPEKQTWILLL